MTDPSSPGVRLPSSYFLDEERAVLSLDPRDPCFYEDPYPVYAELHRAAPVVRWDAAGGLAIADHGLISAILRDRRFGRVVPADETGRPDYSDVASHVRRFYAVERHSLLDLEPPTHTRLRGLVTRAFVSRRIERLAPRICAIAKSLVDGFQDEDEIDLVARFATPLPVIVIAELLGFGPDAHGAMLEWSHRMVAMYRFGRTNAEERAADHAAAEFRAFLLGVIAQKRIDPADDLVSHLIAAQDEGGRLSEDEMISTLILLMNAGHEATVHQIGNGAKAILAAGTEASRLFAGGGTAGEAAVEEVLRIDTPLHLFRRIALEDAEISGAFALRRGETVALLLGAGNHDPKVFADPGRFDAARPSIPHVSFGAGIHFCIGAPLARLELRLAFAALFTRFPAMRIAATPRYRNSYHFRGLEQLTVRLRP